MSSSSSNIQGTVNFTSSSALSLQLPSVFELLAEERLSELIRPCLQKILQFLHENRPLSKILRALYKYKDEFILLIEGLVQWTYLTSYSALIGERYYGFKRTANHRIRSLILSVFLPYVKAKLDSLYEQMRADNSINRSGMFYVMLRILPKVQVFMEGICWLYRIGYAFGRTEYYSPALQLADVKLIYTKEPSPSTAPTSLTGRLFSNIGKIMSSGLFLIQFVDWWNNANGNKAKNAGATVRPPVPSIPRTNSEIGRRQCPLCRQPCNVPTAVKTSGYVFCYNCISDYVNRYQRCPTTNQPVTMADLVKTY